MEGLRHWPDHLESSAILEQANFRARGGDFGTIDQRFAAFSGESLMASVPMCRKTTLRTGSREAGMALFPRHRCEQPSRLISRMLVIEKVMQLVALKPVCLSAFFGLPATPDAKANAC